MTEQSEFRVDTVAGCVECSVCSKKDFPKKMNGIYGKYGHKYYCKKKLCQQRFIEDAGDPPDYE